ncbi:hypothetical protein N7455_008948 [Penicillium solitum]|uniref:uncharacterized protein n=1 Tax=Penicillium solitum TaxID=60172 RepID=UPI001811A3EA|nr:hypothetical protein HAV15_008730 [Penicillium sp. str. \
MTDSLSLNSSPREVLSAPRSGYTRHPTFILEVGLSLSYIGSAPGIATTQNFYLLSGAVYARWCIPNDAERHVDKRGRRQRQILSRRVPPSLHVYKALYVLCRSWNPASYLVGRKYRSRISEFYLGAALAPPEAVQASQEDSLIRLTLRAFDSITYPSPDPARRRKRASRERERQQNITSDTHIPSWGRVAIAKPRSGPLQNKDLRFRIGQIDGAPDLIGPVVSLLLAVEALWQQVGSTASLARMKSLDHAGLIDFRARLVEGDSRVLRAISAK